MKILVQPFLETLLLTDSSIPLQLMQTYDQNIVFFDELQYFMFTNNSDVISNIKLTSPNKNEVNKKRFEKIYEQTFKLNLANNMYQPLFQMCC